MFKRNTMHASFDFVKRKTCSLPVNKTFDGSLPSSDASGAETEW